MNNRSEILGVVFAAAMTLIFDKGGYSSWCFAIGLTLVLFLFAYHSRIEPGMRLAEMLAYASIWGLSWVLVVMPFLPSWFGNPKPDEKGGVAVWLVISLIAFMCMRWKQRRNRSA